MLCYRNAKVAARLFRTVGLDKINELLYLSILECLWQCCLNQITRAIKMPIRHFRYSL